MHVFSAAMLYINRSITKSAPLSLPVVEEPKSAPLSLPLDKKQPKYALLSLPL